jgi:hypothetical protein
LSAPAPLRLRPLEIGDVLDETFRMYRRHFPLFATISVVLAVPSAALAGYGFAAFFSSALNQLSNGTTIDFGSLASSMGAIAVGFVLNLVLLPFTSGAVAYAACESAMGRPVTAWGVVRGVLVRYFHLEGYLLLIVLMGIAFCLFPLWIWIWVGWAVVIPVMFVENVGLGGAMRRSWRLVSERWWRTFFVLFLMFILVEIVAGALGAFLQLGQYLLELFLSPVLSLAISEAASILVSSLVSPILQIAIVLIYFDLRVRKEGLDLFQLAQRVSALPPALA